MLQIIMPNEKDSLEIVYSVTKVENISLIVETHGFYSFQKTKYKSYNIILQDSDVQICNF